MKREALNHTKMKRLCRSLDIRPYEAVGIMESFWHLTAKEAPQGDIGKLSNQDIADAIGWEGSDEKFIESLVSARWVDQDPDVRLFVHDWPEHCEDSVHMRLARLGLLFANGTKPKMTRLSVAERKKAETVYRLCAQRALAVSATNDQFVTTGNEYAHDKNAPPNTPPFSSQFPPLSDEDISLKRKENGIRAHDMHMKNAPPCLTMPYLTLSFKEEELSYPDPFSLPDEQVSEQAAPSANPALCVSPVSLNGNGNSHGKTKAPILNPEQQTWFDGFWNGYWRKNDKHPALVAFGKQIRTESDYQRLVAAFARDRADMLTRPIDKRPCLGPWINKKPWLDDDLASVPEQVRTSPKEAANEAVYQEFLADLRKGKTQ